MAYDVEPSDQADLDLADILQFLYGSFREFGDANERAFERAADRVREIRDGMVSLGAASHQGTLRPELGANVRSVTKGRAILYFEVIEDREALRVLAVFFGGQDHLPAMLARMRRQAKQHG